ncbi:MAG TPA: hypothetical protein V6D47_20545 [Oscillatoriaceae cyanobacterium]
MKRAAIGLLGVALLASPPVATRMEALMATHMGLQMPLLVLAGYGVGADLATRQPAWLRDCNANGIVGTLLAAFTLAFWMLPRWLDGALESPLIEVAKFLTLPLLVGVPLAMSFSRLPAVLRGFAKLNALSMLAFMGWLYLVAPNRLCNNYLLNQQAMLGWTLLAWTAALALFWAAPTLVGRPESP